MAKKNIKYRVVLAAGERERLHRLVKRGKTEGYRIRHAQVLLALDEVPANAHWTDARIGAAYGCRERAVGALRKRFVEEGLEAALGRKKRETAPVVKIDGAAEARIIALACSEPPEGRCRWTLALLAAKTVEAGILASISARAIGYLLKKQN
jgi:hypothetical protein